ncbi:uncharacterized protein [Tenebrio molitor]|uniref:uncharacterized protein isoform X2 n=1 Tax=Tenebrio molitor TaxID=7067 RepID=UPI003624A198
MLNHPFSSTNVNIFDEKTQNSTPTNLCGQNVLMSQEQHRKIFNTLTTSIGGMPGFSPTVHQRYQNPNSITFTFSRNNQNYQPPPNYFWQCNVPTSSDLNTLNQLHQRNAVNLMHMQQQLNPPQQWRFHIDNQTSTSDLAVKPNARADLKNLAGMCMSKMPNWLQTPICSNPKKLILKNVNTAKVEGSICDGLDQDNKDGKTKKVNFSTDEIRKDVEVQVRLCCNSCNHEEMPRRPRERKKRGRKRTPSSTEYVNPHKQSSKERDRLSN